MRYFLLLLSIVGLHAANAQTDSTNIPNSANGWYLSPHGTIRVLVIFAQIDYNKNPGKDPQPNGADHWPKDGLPKWKDNVFDPFPGAPSAMLTRYYHDMSLGDFIVLGDYVDHLVTIRESDYPTLANWSVNAIVEANKLGELHTAHNLSVADFDLWKRGAKPGLPKANVPDDPHSYDHVMVILRNSTLTHGQGSTDPGSSGKLYGYESDTQSRFGAMNSLPFEILKHEFNHMLLGGNNFHSGGGNAATFTSYFIPLQGGWSMMGAASSSLLTGSAWDRDRLGWKAHDTPFRINARNRNGTSVNADLDPVKGDTGVFVLRDFVTSGDALRIHMPYLPDNVYPQWLWIENHQGFARNGCPTDRFHWEDASTCIPPVKPGLFMQMQVDRENRTGKDIYGGQADYLRPVLATGNYDMRLRGDTLPSDCPFGGGHAMPFVEEASAANPLSGSQEQEFPATDRNGDGLVSRKEAMAPDWRVKNGRITGKAAYFGNPEQAFTLDGDRRIGMGTNPSTANMLTYQSSATKSINERQPPDNRVVYLNGISAEIIDQRANGEIVLHVRAHDTRIAEDVRWCADSIVLPALNGRGAAALSLAPRKRILLDRSMTPTRMNAPETVGHRTYFSDVTHFTIGEGATMELGTKSELALTNGSVLHILNGGTLRLQPKARITSDASSRIVLHGDAHIQATEKQLRKLRKKGRIEQR